MVAVAETVGVVLVQVVVPMVVEEVAEELVAEAVEVDATVPARTYTLPC